MEKEIMKGLVTIRKITSALVVALLVAGTLVLHAQTAADALALQTQLRARYDIVALQGGVGFVPKDRSGIRMIEIRDGAVAIDGVAFTGNELRARLGSDADMVLRVTYLDAAGQKQLTSPAPASAAPATPAQERRGDIFRWGDSVTVAENERVDGDVVSFGGATAVNGEVTGDVFVFGDSLTLGPKAVVGGEVNVVGGRLDRASGATIRGEVNEVAFGGRGRGQRGPGVRFGDAPFFRQLMRIGGLVGTVVRIALLLLAAMLVVMLATPTVERIAERTVADPIKSGLTGLVAELLFIPLLVLTVIVLAISIIGIPLLLLVPFGIVLACVMMLVGFTGVAYQVGRWLSGRFGLSWRGHYGSVALGILVIAAVTVVARLVGILTGGALFIGGFVAAIGFLLEYVAWTMGLGAIVLSWLSTRRRFGFGGSPSTPAAAAPAE